MTHFGGDTYDPELDLNRLLAQLEAVRALVLDGQWWTLAQLGAHVGAPEASVSARLRDLRKQRFGGWDVERQRVPGGNGLHRYRVRGVTPHRHLVVVDRTPAPGDRDADRARADTNAAVERAWEDYLAKRRADRRRLAR